MSVAVVFSRGLTGLDAPLVRVEAHVGGGLPQFHIVGLPETEGKEARDFGAIGTRIKAGTALPAPVGVFPRYVEPKAD